MGDVVAAGDRCQRLARLAPGQRLPALMRGQLEAPPELDAPGLRPLAALARAGADQLPLELGKPREHRQHQPTMRGGGVCPGVPERAEGGPALGDGAQGVEQVAGGARQASEPRDQHKVAWSESSKEPPQLLAITARAARLLLEDPLRAFGRELGKLGIEGLPVDRAAGVALVRHSVEAPSWAGNHTRATWDSSIACLSLRPLHGFRVSRYDGREIPYA